MQVRALDGITPPPRSNGRVLPRVRPFAFGASLPSRYVRDDQDVSGVSSIRPASTPNLQTSIAGGRMPSVVNAVQI